MKKIKVPLTLTGSLCLLVACSHTNWDEQYKANNGANTMFNIALSDNEQNIIMHGSILGEAETGEFVAKYNPQGELLWDVTIPNQFNVIAPYFSINTMALTDSNAIFTGALNASNNTVNYTLLSTNGELLWANNIETKNASVSSVLVTNNQTLLAVNFFDAIRAFNLNGELLWSLAEPFDNIDRYVVSGWDHLDFPFQNQLMSKSEFIFYNTGYALFKIDESGGVVLSTDIIDLTTDYFGQFAFTDHYLVVPAFKEDEVAFLFLNEDLQLVSALPLTAERVDRQMIIAGGADDTICFAANLQDGIAIGKAGAEVEVYDYLDASLLSSNDYPVVQVEALGDTCRVSLNLKFDRFQVFDYNAEGERVASYQIEDFVANSAFTVGGGHYSAGEIETNGGVTRAQLSRRSF